MHVGLVAAALVSAARRTCVPALVAESAARFDADVVVVGGGAAGLMSAISAARSQATVILLESGTTPLRKVRISGGGRCNVMHDASTWDNRDGRSLLMQRYPRGAAELTGALTKRFSPLDTAAWFEAEGVELKCEADGRVFPSTDDSATIVDALLGAADRAGVQLKLGARVARVAESTEAGGFVVSLKGQDGTLDALRSRALVLATGSASHDLAAALGHEIATLTPSLFSFRLPPGGMLDASLAGVSVPDVELTLVPAPAPSTTADPSPQPAGRARRRARTPRGRTISARGPLLVTHRGVSGPAALKLSAFGALELSACGYRGHLKLNLVPERSRAEVVEALAAFRARTPLKAVANANPFALPKRLWAALVVGPSAASAASDAPADADAAHAVDPATPWQQLSKRDLRALEARTCCMLLPFSGKDSNKDEFVTAGGVDWAGVDATRMESKHVRGLFFAGEVLNVDGVTGGHNFQSCWTTGWVSGSAAAEYRSKGAQ